MHPRSLMVLGLALGLSVGVAQGEADARSCIRHAYENLDLELLQVRVDGVVVDSPEPPTLNAAMNSASGGRWLLVLGQGFGRFFQLSEALPASETQSAYIESSSERILSTSCGAIPYAPIRPGRYVFAEDHGGDAEALPREAELLVAGDRQALGLRYHAGGQLLEVEYRVTCAHFDWSEGGNKGPCGPVEAPSPLFAEVPPKTPVYEGEPPRIEPTTPPATTAPRGCAVIDRSAPASALALALALLTLARGRSAARTHRGHGESSARASAPSAAAHRDYSE